MQLLGGRRLISVLGMLVDALTGGVLFGLVALAAPLWLAAVLLVACATGAYLAARRPQSQARKVVLGDALQLGPPAKPTRAGCPRGLP